MHNRYTRIHLRRSAEDCAGSAFPTPSRSSIQLPILLQSTANPAAVLLLPMKRFGDRRPCRRIGVLKWSRTELPLSGVFLTAFGLQCGTANQFRSDQYQATRRLLRHRARERSQSRKS